MAFKNVDEFKLVFERIFQLMNEHPEVGRALRDAHAPHRFDITDLGLEFNVTAADPDAERDGRFLRWVWGAPPWEPVITMTMTSTTANRFFQGKENVLLAITLGRVKISGPLATILKLAPVTNPIHPVYRNWLKENRYYHLVE